MQVAELLRASLALAWRAVVGRNRARLARTAESSVGNARRRTIIRWQRQAQNHNSVVTKKRVKKNTQFVFCCLQPVRVVVQIAIGHLLNS